MRSIRGRLRGALLVGVGLSVLVAGLALDHVVLTGLRDEFDETLAGRVATIAALLEEDDGRLELDLDDVALAPYAPGPEAEYFEIRGEAGRLATSMSLTEGAALPHLDELDEVPRGGGVAGDVVLPDGRRGRALGRELLVRRDDPWRDPDRPPRAIDVVVARATTAIDGATAALRAGIAFAALVVLACALVTVEIAIRRGLAPLVALGRRVDAIDATTLSQRVGEERLPVELRGLGRRVDELLERLEAAFERERRMTASLAHELRTPLAELRSAVDVARRWPDDRELAERALRTAHATAVGLGETVDALLHLARLVAGRETLELERVDVGALIDETWGPLADRAAARGVTLRNDVGPGFAVTTDRRLLRGALGNLLANAAVHGDEGAVVCRGVRENGAVACSCSNATGALDAADLPHLTEPLWRGSTARSERAHAGLGLALVETICETLGARLGLSLAERRLTATLSFPADAATD